MAGLLAKFSFCVFKDRDEGFLVPYRQRNHRKSFYCHGKYFAKENFRAFDEILLREQNGQSRAGSISPSCPLG